MPGEHGPGIRPFDLLAPNVTAASKLMYPAYTPFRRDRRLDPEQAARMEAQRRETERMFEQHRAEWQGALNAADNDHVRAGLELHKPQVIDGKVTCDECSFYDEERLSPPGWPCNTYEALTP